MGNSSSAGNCFVQLDKVVFNPGEHVSGVLHLNLIQPANIEHVEIKVSGKEVTYWNEEKSEYIDDPDGSGSRKNVKKHEHHYGKKEFFRVKVPVFTPAGPMLPGQYSFPFAFKLPESLPGSCNINGMGHFSRHSMFDSSCRYKVKGLCKTVGMLKANIKHEQLLVIAEKPPPIVGTAISDTVQVNWCCCCNRGDFYVAMRALKNSYCGTANEIIQMSIDMNNNTKDDVDRVHAELVHRLVLKANCSRVADTQHCFNVGSMKTHHAAGHGMSMGGRFYHEDVVASQVIPGVKSGEGIQDLQFQIPVSRQLQPQCLGFLIESCYYLRVWAHIRCSTKPTVKVPICIYAPQPPPESWQAPSAPPGWNPQVMQACELNIPSCQPSPSATSFIHEFQPSAPPLNMAARDVYPSAPLQQELMTR